MTLHATATERGAVGPRLDGGVRALAPERADGRVGALAGQHGPQCAAPGQATSRSGALPRRHCRGLRKATWRPSRPPLMGGLPLLGLVALEIGGGGGADDGGSRRTGGMMRERPTNMPGDQH